jgi:hypothetical protein
MATKAEQSNTGPWNFSAPALIAQALITVFMITIAPGITAAAVSAWWSIMTLIPSKWTQCYSLTWKEISEGDLHICEETCPHATTADNSEFLSISTFFNNRNNHSNRRSKPQDLELGQEYFRTDTKTLRAILLLYPGVSEQEREPTQEYGVRSTVKIEPSFKKIKTDNEPDGYILTASVFFRRCGLEVSGSLAALSVQKLEMDKFFEGYPPWYRSHITLPNNQLISHPIRNPDDLARGGWIIAIGLRNIKPISHHLMKFTLDERGCRNYTAISDAFVRMQHCAKLLGAKMKEAFPTEDGHELYKALEEWLIDSQVYQARRSGMSRRDENIPKKLTEKFVTPESPNDRWFDPADPSPTSSNLLSTEQYELAMRLFSEYEPTKHVDVTNLRLITEIVIRSAMIGTYAVMKYMADYVRFHKHKFIEFAELEKDGLVFVVKKEVQE